MSEMIQVGEAATRYATIGYVEMAYQRHSRHWLIIAMASVVVVVIGLAGYTTSQDLRQRDATRHQCELRRSAVLQSNAFYNAMANLEASNPFIDQPLRDERVRLYRSVLFQVPTC